MGSLFGGSSKSTPMPAPPPKMDVAAVGSKQQGEGTRSAYEQAAFNRVNQSDALGNTLQYSQTGTDAQGNPIFSASQQLGKYGQQAAGGLAGLGGQYFSRAGDTSGLGSNDALDRAYGFASANLEPRFQRATDAAENRLRNQGLDPTSEAYKSQMNDLALQQNEARNNLVTGLQGQMFSQGLQQRQQGMSELQPGVAFASGSLNPNYVNPSSVNVGPVDYAGLETTAANQANQIYGMQLQQYNTDRARQTSEKNAMLGGLAGLAGTIGGAVLGGPIGAGIGKKLFSSAVAPSNPYEASGGPY